MKLLIVTAVSEFRDDVIKMFRNAQIDRFSGSEIDGYKNGGSFIVNPSWFVGEGTPTESELYFSFTEDENIDRLFEELRSYNSKLETDNPVRAIVAPIERFI